MRRLTVLLGIAASGAAAPAWGQSAAQLQAIENVAMAHAFERGCPALKIDMTKLASTFVAGRVKPADIDDGGRFQDVMVAKARYASGVVARQSQPVACGIGRGLFGPAGSDVPGLLVSR